MTGFGWKLRLKYGLLAGLAGWVAGWLAGWPFEVKVAWRYVDGHARLMPGALAKGLLVWAAFSLFMAVLGFLPLVLPLFLLAPPAWIVRARRVLIPVAPLVAMVAIDRRMGLLNTYHLYHREELRAFFFTAPNWFVITFGLVVIWVYIALAQRRLAAAPDAGT